MSDIALPATPAGAAAAQPNTRQRLKSIFGGCIGNLVEWYDWYVYAAFSMYFAKSFFPAADSTAQLMSTAAVFAVGFLMRPIGGLLLGAYADRRGRKAALTLSVMMMCLGSLIIALTPGYATIGGAAPVMLLLARLLQGVSVGGEYGASATYLSEMAGQKNRGFYSSFQYVTLIMGQLTALSVLIILQLFLLTPAQLESWGWRIPFFIGALCALVALYLRRNLAETEAYVETRKQGISGSKLHALMRHPREVMVVIGLTLGGTVAFYTYTTYMQKFMVNTVGLTKDASTLVSAAALFIFMCLQPLMGSLSDRIGRRPLLIAFGILGTFCTVPILSTMAATRDPLVAALVIVSGYTSINAVVKAELFPASVRALGVGLPYAIANSLFGGTAEYVALWFKSNGTESLFYWYVSGCIACSLLVYAFMPDTRSTSKIETE